MYGEGISKTGELLDLGVNAGIIEKSGAWFSYGDQRIGQGRENAKTFLKENVEIAIDIEQRVRQSAAILTEVMLEGGGLEINDGESENEDLATAGLPKELPIEK